MKEFSESQKNKMTLQQVNIPQEVYKQNAILERVKKALGNIIRKLKFEDLERRSTEQT